ncbi:MAG: PfkB family carbohydrate kinase, partial [Myxococcota bacterium]|nr:PfkB family carbohydrate kinase [Myxococcota bacterium]
MTSARAQVAGDAPNVLVCAGLDPSGGAGLLADVRIIALVGARPLGIVTAATVQDTLGVRAIHPLDAEMIGEQLAAVLGDVEVRAVKLGLLGSLPVVREIGRALAMTAAPVVWDPVGMPSRGGAAFDRELFDEALRELAPHLALITPNAHELAAFAGRPLRDLESALVAAHDLSQRADTAVLVKGGHLPPGGPTGGPAGDEALDVLVERERVTELRGPRVPGG